MNITIMINADQLQQVNDHVTSAQTILVIYPDKKNYDQAAVAASLFLSLKQLGKKVLLLSPDEPGEAVEGLHGIGSTTTKIGNQNLHVVFDYTPEKVDKVSYHIDEESQKFLLIVQPQKGQTPLDSSSVEFTYGGAEADAIFLVGVKDLSQLEQLYQGYENVFSDATTISLNTYQASCADINLDTSGMSSICEATFGILDNLGVNIDADVATNLLAGIEDTTESFRSLTTMASTFQTASKLMTLGARRIRRQGMPAKPAIMQQKEAQKKASSKKVVEVLKQSKKKQNKGQSKPGGLNYQPTGQRK